MKTQSFISSLILFSLILLMSVSSVFAQGVAFRGAGAVNESMGGAAAACPLSATGALYWNPATMNAFHGTTVDVDLGLALPETTISSRLPDAMGGFGGSETKSDTGAVPIPNVAIIRHYDDSPFAFGFSFGAVGGARTNYTDSHLTENPILSNDTLPNGMKVGYGNLNSSIQLLQIAANLSYAVTDKFSLSIGPTLTMGEVSCDPLYVIEGHSTPDTAIHGAGNRYVFGAGFQVGFYYDTKMGWSFGGSYKSPNWIEDIEYQSNHHENTELKLDYPSIITLGACWYGWDKWTFAWDVRYFLYESAGFDQLGWSNMWAFSMGVQRELSDRVTVRAGYSFNENQLDSAFSRANIAVPLIPQHALFLGTSLRLDCRTTLHLTYGHIFKSTSSGPYMGKGYEALGGDVTISAEADEIVAGISFNF